MKWRWLLALLPLGLGLILSTIWHVRAWVNPIVYARLSLSLLVALLGLLLSILIIGFTLHRQNRQAYAARNLGQYKAKAAEDRRQFLRRLDHELKNPLMAIRAGLTNLSDAPTASLREAAFTSVESQTVRLSRLTADLRKIAELETRPLEYVAIDLPELLQETITLIEERYEAKKRNLLVTLPQAPWPLPTISGDWDLIFLAVYNLVENAAKFTAADDTIELRAREDGRYIVIEIADTGPGIDSGEITHVWEELYRGRAGQGIPGSGLGLALVKAIAERHNGGVSIHSRPGKGTVIAMRLPIN